MRIFVVGGSKGVGLCLTKLALEKDYKVTVLSRNAENMPIVHKNLTKINGNAKKLEDLEENVKDSDVVISAIGTRNNTKNQNLFSESTKNILASINGSNKLFIAITGIGVKETLGRNGFFYEKIVLPLFLKNIYKDKDREEEIIKHSNTQWIIVRPGFLTNGPLTGRYKIITDMNQLKTKQISRMDVAHFILTQVEDPVYIKMAPVITY